MRTGARAPMMAPMTNTMTHSQMMTTLDGTARLWIQPGGEFAKLVRDGRTIARIDRLTDGTCRATANGERAEGLSWVAACQWITARATAEALTAGLEVLAAA